jgi:sulfur carrier protein ThiS adenylyltransferase
MKISDLENILKKFRVGIAGAGGLGSNCAVALARAGIGTLVIADFDKVERSNLSRQYYFISQIGKSKVSALRDNLMRIRPEINVIAHKVKLDEKNIREIFNGCDVIVEAFDKAEMKEMLIESVSAEFPVVPIVVGSGVAGWGRIELIKVKKVDDTLYLCGDEVSGTTDELPPLAPRVAVVANLQADTVIGILIDKASHPDKK